MTARSNGAFRKIFAPKHALYAVRDFLLHEPQPDKTAIASRHSSETAWLDGLRGVAALLVVLQHIHHPATLYLGFCYGAPISKTVSHDTPAALPLIRIFFTGGSFAVMVFFVISGYVVPRRLISLIHQGRQQDFINAMNSAVVRRPVRLLVPAMLSTLATMIFYHLSGIQPLWSGAAPNVFAEFWYWILDSLQFMDYFHAFASNYNLVTWTIPLELKGSMAIFMWLFAFHQVRTQNRVLLTIGVVLYLTICTIAAQYAAFFAGMLLSELDLLHASGEIDQIWVPWTRISNFLRKRRLIKSFFLHLTLLVGLLLASTPTLNTNPTLEGKQTTPSQAIEHCPAWPTVMWTLIPWPYWKAFPSHEYRDYWYFWAAILILASVKEIRWAKGLFDSRIARYLGRHSFALYLTHTVVAGTLTRTLLILTGFGHLGGKEAQYPYNRIPIAAWIKWFPKKGWPDGLQPAVLFSGAASLVVMLFVAEIGTKLFDEPSIRLSAWTWERFKRLM